jgi:hypothetical protein
MYFLIKKNKLLLLFYQNQYNKQEKTLREEGYILSKFDLFYVIEKFIVYFSCFLTNIIFAPFY